jgi:hypothetical protein
MTEQLELFLSEWTSAELAGDTKRLSALLTDDFYGVGPLGFVLPRPEWIDRHRQGLVYEAFGLDETQLRLYDSFSLVTARNNARGTYQGQPLPGALRCTLVITSDSRAHRLAAIHMSFIGGMQEGQ